jgi:transcriptional regulator with XRE-family HTH domain
MDGLRLGSVVRTVRIRKGLRQADVAAGAHVSIATVSRIERGNLESASVGVVVRIAAVLEIRLDWMPRWRGGELDRMLNAGHAAMHEAAARDLAGSAWLTAAETTFAIYGERGIIDILAFHPDRRALLVIELKTDIVDVQGLIGAVDRYRRLAPRIARERGWISTSVSRWVLLRDSPSNHRRLAAHPTWLRKAFPADGRRRRPGYAERMLPSPRCRSYRILMPGELAALSRAPNGSGGRGRAWIGPGMLANSLVVRIRYGFRGRIDDCSRPVRI